MLPDPDLGRQPGPAGVRRPGLPSVPSVPDPGGPAAERPAWEARYVRSAIVLDAAAVTAACTATVLFSPHISDLGNDLLSAALAPAVALLLLVAISASGALDPAVLGAGTTEYRRLVRGFAATAIGLGLAGLAAGLADMRFWVFAAIPAACLLTALGRFALRTALRRRRAAGTCSRDVLAVGTAEAVGRLITRTRLDRHLGWEVTGACTPTGAGLDGTDAILGVPVVGDLDDVAKVARRRRHDIVSVSVTPGWSSARLNRLAWDIHELGVELVVDPGLTEVAGPRLRAEPVDGLPLLRLTRPTLSGAARLVKGVVDRSGAAVLLLLLAPLLLGLAVAIRLSGGPVLVWETHVGHGGRPFRLLRFGSDEQATRVGGWVCHHGLDRLPQLLNVLAGSMSLVGPRPARLDEVASYPPEIRTAHVVRPGLTGLWPSFGYTSLAAEESFRLDLRYVQHWSLLQDAAIAWDSVRAATGAGRR